MSEKREQINYAVVCVSEFARVHNLTVKEALRFLDIHSIDLALCRPYKDFGKGFYTTDILEQAQKMAKRIARIYGGNPIVNMYEIAFSLLRKVGVLQ